MAGDESRTLEDTPTWAVAAVSAIFIVASLLIERAIFGIGKLLKKRNQISLYESLEKIKEELMLFGFMSLLLTMFQNDFAKICIPEKYSHNMLPCAWEKKSAEAPKPAETIHSELSLVKRRLEGAGPKCHEDKVHLIPSEGLHQLHILIFIMAGVHVIYSVATMALGKWRVHQWKYWEAMTKTEEYRSTHGSQVRFTRDSTFIKRHAASIWSRNPFLAYTAACFQQFSNSMTQTDYLTLRHGFIEKHMNANVNFDFHKYILRSLEDDFKHVVGISPPLWIFTIIVLLLNVHGWQTYFWMSIIPLIMLLVIGTKLRSIITALAIDIIEKHSVIDGIPTVKPNDKLFWFNRPQLTLSLVHFILFQNAFEIAYYIWILGYFGSKSCLQDGKYFLLARLLLGVFVQALCGYVTLPLYALVSQMGSHMKRTIFEEHTALALQRWHKKAKGNAQNRNKEASTDGESLEGRTVAADHGDFEHDVEGEAGNINEEENKEERGSVERRMSYMQRAVSRIQNREAQLYQELEK